jgi:hypothetical protein
LLDHRSHLDFHVILLKGIILMSYACHAFQFFCQLHSFR